VTMTSPPRLRLASFAPLAALLFAGCADKFTPGSVIEDLRVLAIVADPPEVWLPATLPPTPAGPFQLVTLRATAVAPPATPGGPPRGPATEAWTFCPFSTGASSGYACAAPACETVLTPAADGSVTVDPIALGLACIGGPGGSLPGAPAGSGLPAQVEVLVRYVATLDGQRREAVQRIPVHTGTLPPGLEANANPIIPVTGAFTSGVDCGGAASGCAVGSVRLDVAVDPTSFQLYPGGLDRSLQETVDVSFFTTAGRFQYEKGLATAATPSTSMVLDATELNGAREALVWAVARDQRGGEAVAGPRKVVFSVP
jgi:hypothetical protein